METRITQIISKRRLCTGMFKKCPNYYFSEKIMVSANVLLLRERLNTWCAVFSLCALSWSRYISMVSFSILPTVEPYNIGFLMESGQCPFFEMSPFVVALLHYIFCKNNIAHLEKTIQYFALAKCVPRKLR